MSNGEKLRRYGIDKVAFSVLLVLGLLLARFIISSRSSFKLSEPVTLKGTGLEVSVPSSDNWKLLSNGFKYENNDFTLAAALQISSDSAITVQWKYSMLPPGKNARQRIESLAASIEGHIESSGEDKFGQFTFHHAKIVSENVMVLCGTTVLSDNRILTLQVAQKGAGFDLAEKVFKALLASAKYHFDCAILNGIEFIKNFKTSFLSELAEIELSRQGLSNYYRIKDIRGTSIGFTTDTISFSTEPNENMPLTAAVLLFLSPSYNTFAEQSLFRADIELKTFDWAIKQGNLTNRQQPSNIQLKNNILTIENSGKIKEVPFTDIMIPDTLLDVAVAAFLKSDYDTIMFEDVLSDGKLSPVILSRIKTSETSVLPPESSAQAEFYGAYPVTQKMYYDGEGRLVSADVQGGFSYRLERTTKAEILADFPQWLDKIQQIEQYLLKKTPPKKSKAKENK